MVLGAGITFELPVLVFLLTAIGLVTPRFLVKHSRYAILAIFLLAAVITPSQDVVNLMLMAGPMCVLFAAGVLASYLYAMRREGRTLPWRRGLIAAGSAGAIGAAGYFAWRRWGRK